jgi:quercetin dioxygenase-like cupin family protein
MKKFALSKSSEAEKLDFDWGTLYWYASGAQGNSDYQTVGRCVLTKGMQNPKHYHPDCEEVLYVLSGKIEHFVDGQGWLAMSDGDTITVARNVWHQARNVGDSEAHLLICFSSAQRTTVGE